MCAKAVALAARPEGMPKTSDFQIVDIESNDPADGEIQVKNICMSVDHICVVVWWIENRTCLRFK